MLTITILGSGSAEGVPMIGCSCKVCCSKSAKNKRTRQSILIEYKNTKLLIDASPDLRAQILANKIKLVDKILITHPHADHIGGLSELRGFCINSKKGIDIFSSKKCIAEIKERFSYLFNKCRVGRTAYVNILNPHILTPNKQYKIGSISFTPFIQSHGETTSLGFMFDDFVYSTDMKAIDNKTVSMIKGTKLWMVDCVSCLKRYPAHTNLEETLSLCKKVQAKKVLLIHMSHDVDYLAISKKLPPHVKAAYDGMKIRIKKHA